MRMMKLPGIKNDEGNADGEDESKKDDHDDDE